MTAVFTDEFKGYPICAIWAIDDEGEKKGKKPIVSFGLRKAKNIAKHKEEIEEWIQEQERSNNKENKKDNVVLIDLSKLSIEQIKSLKKITG